MALGHHTDQELLVLLRQGGETAFVPLYDRFKPKIRHFALRISGSPEMVGEIVQNVLLKLWQNTEQTADIRNLGGWLFRVTSNKAFDFLKKAVREKTLAEEIWTSLQEEPRHAEQNYVLKEYLQVVADAIRSLPPQQQRVYRPSWEVT